MRPVDEGGADADVEIRGKRDEGRQKLGKSRAKAQQRTPSQSKVGAAFVGGRPTKRST